MNKHRPLLFTFFSQIRNKLLPNSLILTEGSRFFLKKEANRGTQNQIAYHISDLSGRCTGKEGFPVDVVLHAAFNLGV